MSKRVLQGRALRDAKDKTDIAVSRTAWTIFCRQGSVAKSVDMMAAVDLKVETLLRAPLGGDWKGAQGLR